jgi:predicted TIM-barrel fold metal-dependent hydrolase
MRIIDAQVHIWSSDTPIEPHRPVSVFTKDELLAEMAAAGVDAAVIHPSSWNPTANAIAIDAVRAHPDKFSILGHFLLDRLESRAG